jgi:hypothetical protein
MACQKFEVSAGLVIAQKFDTCVRSRPRSGCW